ncbi:Predicted phosphohydrolase or phosphomutase, AlkP superfamily [Halogranum rubrum]|uniref:Predicted phosphohydrolase or phosphomutase, AlkP superfamily n=1 Tax=Halogranum rubrum TaxID=553466 RepID=A0A1I4GX45_9EURY|nr:alkaline phosphatase family protein [Halogranum rubrum]SFL34525.1 Predicted phosphohydrolase or phosphomutase, AlkP superfamily [Halogranum rubrum]
MDTLLVGIDAACGPVLDPLFEAGALPALASLVEDGTSGPLESQLPPWTPSAWPSLYTGTNPGRHGAYSFLTYDGYDWDVVDAHAVREPSLWELLDAHGLSSVVVNVPVTCPPATIDGAVVPGFTAPEDPPCHPEGILDDVREAIGEYTVYGSTEFADADREERRAEYTALVRSRGAAFRYLADRFDPDFGFVQFQQSDTVVHDFPGDRDLLETVYRAIDDELGETLAACDPNLVVVASDHGIGPYDGYEFCVNEFLRREGYVETTREGDSPSWVPIWRDNLRADAGESTTSVDPSLTTRALDTAGAVGLSPARVATLLDRVGLLEAAMRVVPDSVRRQTGANETVDFAASTAYCRLPVELGIRLNVAGREPEGVVDPAQYESVRAELMTTLRNVETPDGELVFESVLPREEVFHGPELDDAVDIVTVPSEFDHLASARVGGDVFVPPHEPWNHKRYGFVAVGGPDAPATNLTDTHLLDVAPTVLSSLGVPLSDRMDGDVLPGFTAPGTETYPRAAHDSHGRSTAHVKNRLADLGYL